MIIVGAIGLLLFLLPVPIIGFQLGNTTGAVVFILILLIGIFQRRVVSLMQSLWASSLGKVLLGLAGVVCAVICILVIAETFCMTRAAMTKPDPDATVLVLGCQVKNGKPGRMLTARLERALDHLEENPGSICILCGGRGEDEAIEEAAAMHEWLVDRGVDPARLIMEDRSTSTEENLLNAQTIIREQGFNDSVAIVTDGFHEYRAIGHAESIGLTAGAVPVRTSMLYFPTYYVRELYGILYTWLGR